MQNKLKKNLQMKIKLTQKWSFAALVLGLGINASHALTISGGTATITLQEGMAQSIDWLDADFSDAVTRKQCLTNAAPGDASFVRLSGVPGTVGTSTTAGMPGTPGQVQVIDPIRPFGEIPNPPLPDTYPGSPGASRSRQVTTLDFNPSSILGSWTPSTDSYGIFVNNVASSEQIAFTCMQRWGGPFTGVLLYGDFALRYVPTRVGMVESGGTLSGLALVSNIDFLNSSWADLANASISFTNNTLNVSGDLLISGALNVLDPTAVVGTKFGTFNMTATVSFPAPVISQFAVSGGNATLQATNGLPGSPYTVLSTTNITLPATSWDITATGTFADDGTTTNSIPVPAGENARFFRLQQP